MPSRRIGAQCASDVVHLATQRYRIERCIAAGWKGLAYATPDCNNN
jgi:hypothetical protein